MQFILVKTKLGHKSVSAADFSSGAFTLNRRRIRRRRRRGRHTRARVCVSWSATYLRPDIKPPSLCSSPRPDPTQLDLYPACVCLFEIANRVCPARGLIILSARTEFDKWPVMRTREFMDGSSPHFSGYVFEELLG